MNTTTNEKFNPNPGTKFLILIGLGVSLTHSVGDVFNLLIVSTFCLFFILLKKTSTAIKILIFYGLVIGLSYYTPYTQSIFVRMYLVVLMIIKLFFLPILAGKFLVETSDVTSMLATMSKIKIPNVISIPIAVAFRFFPAYKQERASIKLAMKMRGISFRNPIQYLEFVFVPLLISSSNLADDIAKSAETKCIADPCKKTRYKEIKFKLVDLIFILLISGIFISGKIFS